MADVLQYKGQKVLNQDEQRQYNAEREYNQYYAAGLNSIANGLRDLVNTIQQEAAEANGSR